MYMGGDSEVFGPVLSTRYTHTVVYTTILVNAGRCSFLLPELPRGINEGVQPGRSHQWSTVLTGVKAIIETRIIPPQQSSLSGKGTYLL